MSQQFFDSMRDKAEFVRTWLLTLVNGQQYILIPVDAHDSIMDAPEDGSIRTGNLLNGGTIEVPDSQILTIEEYEVGHRTNKGIRRETCNSDRVERIVNQNTDRSTGEVKGVQYIREKGNSDNAAEQKPEGWKW
ncbi:MAG: hypothetical protein NW224_12010 [Leptolyngbyaceae cyanobacterium bins.302]|nr:hypothetical protein [Leptolyngbyaceae cyanobacterium bins.302]